MKCMYCQTDNKDGVKNCRKCGADMVRPPLWKPTWKWHAKTLVIIYGVLLVTFFLLNHLLKPYLRQIPKDITPWLQELPKQEAIG